MAGLSVKTCRAAHIIHYSQIDPEAFDKQYHHLTIDTVMAWPPAPIKLMGEDGTLLRRSDKSTMEKTQAAAAPVRIPEPEMAPRAATKSETASNDRETKKKELQDMMKILNRIAQGEPWQAIPEVAAYGEPITAQEAAAALCFSNISIVIPDLIGNP